MKFDDLPKDLQEFVHGLKHGSVTIESDVVDALEDAKTLRGFKDGVVHKMRSLISECEGVIEDVRG